MEVFEIENGWDLIKVSMTPGGGVYADLPIRFGDRNSEFRETIVLEDRGWRFSSIQMDCVDYYFHLWLKHDGRMAWVNDLSTRIEETRDPFDPDYPNMGVLNDAALNLYNIVEKIKAYQKRGLPTHEIFELRKYYLETTLKMLGYDSIDAVSEKLDDSRGYLSLTKAAKYLEDYIDLSSLVYSEKNLGTYDMIRCRARKDVTREEILEYAKPVKEKVDNSVEFMKRMEEGLQYKREIQPGYRKNMREKVGEYTWDAYEEKVKEVALLLLELNADLLTDGQRTKLGIPDFKVLDDITVKDKISKLIDSKEFSDACRIEDEFAYQEARELVTITKETPPQNLLASEENAEEKIFNILQSELEEIKERESAVATHDRIHAKYYSKTRSNGRKVKALEDEYII